MKVDDTSARTARIEKLLEELRLNTEDLHELARQATERTRRMRAENREMRDRLRQSQVKFDQRRKQ